ARGVLAQVSGEPDPDGKTEEIRNTLQKEHRSSFADLRGPRFGLHALVWVGIGMAALQQLVGINAIFYYSTTLWKSVGFSESSSFTTYVITAVLKMVMTQLRIILFFRVRRRELLIIRSIE